MDIAFTTEHGHQQSGAGSGMLWIVSKTTSNGANLDT
jgi:hypothetical protein